MRRFYKLLPIERLNKIKQILEEQESIKISELSHILNVSEMTVHRDLKPLVNEGIVIKTFGGVSLKQREPSNVHASHCVYCNRSVNNNYACRLFLDDGQIETLCCAHCGLLRYNHIKDYVKQAVCHDFLRHTTISTHHAFYVFDTSLDIGCCQPQVLTFEWEDHAFKFTEGFGGTVHSFDDATKLIEKKMNAT